MSERSLSVKGHLKIFKRIEGEKDVLLDEGDNLITNLGFQQIARMWGGPQSPNTYADERPFYIAAGNPGSPTAPTTSDTQLESEQFRKTFSQRTFLGAPVNGVQFEMLMDKSEGGTLTYTEAGLFAGENSSAADSGELIARRTFTGIPKNGSFQIVFQWSFTFTAA